MSDGVTLSIYGNRGILDNLDRFQGTLQEALQKKLEEAGQVALEVANELVPVDTGYLKSTLYLETEPGQVKIGADAEYTLPVELGHVTRSGSFVPAQPFLIPALEFGAQWFKDSLPGLVE